MILRHRYEDNVASMAWKLHAIEQTQLRKQHRDDGVGRLKLDCTQITTELGARVKIAFP